MEFEDYSRTFLHFYTKETPELLIETLPKEKFSLIDLGAGDGVLLVALGLNGHLENASEVVAVDISDERCSRLEKHTGVKVICSDVTNIPEVPSNSFDYVICTQVIEHVDQDKLLEEIKRILRPGGTLYIASVIKKWYGWWYYKTAAGKWALDPTHLREYESQEEYENIISNAGFSIKKTLVTPFKLSVVEFLIRRVFCKFFNINEINKYFLKYKIADYLRKYSNIRVPGYRLVETIAHK